MRTPLFEEKKELTIGVGERLTFNPDHQVRALEGCEGVREMPIRSGEELASVRADPKP